MSLKQAIAKRRTQKSGGMMEAMLLQEVYNKIEALVVTEYKEKLALLEGKTEDFSEKLTTLADKLTKETTETANTEKTQLLEEVKQAIQDMKAIKASLTNDMNFSTTELLNTVSRRADEILSNIEKQRGPQGEPGAPGKPGANGSPDAPKEIASKLNKTKESVNLSVIKGLQEKLEQVTKLAKRGGGKGGGGVGQPQHETKSVGSGTTTISTQYPIAAGGRFVFLFYQGQNLAYDTHYTVGGDHKTITLTFTPTDSTFIDVTYIRGS